jgi:predicted GH43/DUF377 family glycosyl hydrolase
MKKQNHELFVRYKGNPILSIGDWPYNVNAVFNAAAGRVDGKTMLLVRAEDFRGISHLTAARSADGITDWKIDERPTMLPKPDTHPEEIWGIEDPRITWLEELSQWAICYTSYSRSGPLVSLATTTDFQTFKRLGPVMPPEDKDAALFPVRFNGLWAMLHRPVPTQAKLGAHIWLSFSPDLVHWGSHTVVIQAREGGWWDANKIGLCTPPLATDEGWLILYHGVRTTASGSIYRLGLALLDLKDPARLIHRSDEWIFGPRAHYEREGDVDDVIFPCGWIVKDDMVHIYYGAADTCIGYATASLNNLMNHIKNYPVKSI